MKPIATWCFKPYLASHGVSWLKTEHMITAAIRSIDLVAKNYSKPTVYTDSLGYEILSSLTPNATFLNVYDHIFDDVSPKVWALPKLLSYQVQTEPYFHFDLDFLCLKRFEDSLFENDLLVEHFEDLHNPDIRQYYELPSNKELYIFPNVYNNLHIIDIDVPNLGFFYISDMNLNKIYTDMALSLVTDNKLIINNSNEYFPMPVIEQQTLGLLIHQYNKKVKVLMEPKLGTQYNLDIRRWGDEFVHFSGPRKSMMRHLSRFIIPYITNDIIKASEYIDTLRISN